MYRIYLFNREGRCVAPVHYALFRVALADAMTFIPTVPRVMITNADNQCIFDAEHGKIVHPRYDYDALYQRTFPHHFDLDDGDSIVEMIRHLNGLVYRLVDPEFDVSEQEALRAELNQVDLYIQGCRHRLQCVPAGLPGARCAGG